MEKNNDKFNFLSENWNIKLCMLQNIILPTKRLRKNDNIFTSYTVVFIKHYQAYQKMDFFDCC